MDFRARFLRTYWLETTLFVWRCRVAATSSFKSCQQPISADLFFSGFFLIIKELQPGDYFAQDVNGHAVRFEVIAIQPVGHEYQVTFRSAAGDCSAHYSARAVIATATLH